MNNLETGKKVFVGMSGGVDSSVTAALLQEQGYDVTGVYMKNWSGDDYGIQADCPWEKDQTDAESVCKHLNIPFRSFNFEKEYREKVVEYFFNEYEAGRTPNPDVMCNKEIKFQLFLNRALAEGADYIATGHYVRKEDIDYRVQNAADGQMSNVKGQLLLKGVDRKKDQSYFLYALTQEQLQKSLFPIGEYQKSEVRDLARKFGLPTAEKPDSQGICFIGEINVRDFLKQRLGEETGDIVDVDTKEVVGTHNGAHFYTNGQREGIGIGGKAEPYYVVGTDVEKNVVYVGMGNNHPALFKTEVYIEDLHLINANYKLGITNYELSASIRYRHDPQPGILEAAPPSEKGAGGILVPYKFTFNEPQRAITVGQSLVIYDGDVCLGGGVIVNP